MRKTIRRSLILVPVIVAAYLGTAGLWAASAIDDILALHPVETIPVRLTPQQAGMLLAVEDPTFFSHGGVSLANGQGATTLSSALARDVFLYRSGLGGVQGALQSFFRGVFECCKKVDIGRDVMAIVLDRHVSKERQLAMFVDQVYMGRHQGTQLRGLEPASQALMNKPLSALEEHEFSALIGMIKAPNQLHPVMNAPAHRERSKRVHAIATGTCLPQGWFDTDYESCSVALTKQ